MNDIVESSKQSMGNFPAAGGANAILWACEKRDILISPMKLQKLIYFVHGYYLALTDKPWIDEMFEAWEFGPVLPSIYHEFKHFGSDSITIGVRATAIDSGNFQILTPNSATEFDCTGSDILDYVIDTYGAKTAIYLSELTHKLGSPWYETRKSFGTLKNADIPNDLIRKYFEQLIKA